MRGRRLLFAASIIGFVTAQAGAAWAICPPGGCPKGYACAGNPIYSTCVKVKAKGKKSSDSAPMSMKLSSAALVANCGG